MSASQGKLELREFSHWNAPHHVINQLRLLVKFIEALNVAIPSGKEQFTSNALDALDVTIIKSFSHQMMPAWLAVAKSYYPFYKTTARDQTLITELESELNIKLKDYESLSVLLKKVFLTKYPEVNSQYQLLLEQIAMVMAKLTSVVLSTPALINDAHQHDKTLYEEAGPSMSSCVAPIETILRAIMGRAEIDKSVTIAATSLLLQVKATKSHFEQIVLMQKLERVIQEKLALQTKVDEVMLGGLPKEEQLAVVKLFKLHRKVNQYHEHLTAAVAQSPQDKHAGDKLVRVTAMKQMLEDDKQLPSQRVIAFKHQLDDSEEQLKNHRDPIWTRFLRDSIRILALTFSGIAIYRALTSKSVNFFKPSHGERFVDDSNRITLGS